jgi:PIN domain nuclease of toxin-antitoxin system
VSLDTSALIAHLNGNELASSAATFVVDEMVAKGRNEAVISMVSALEILVHPLSVSQTDYKNTRDFFDEHTKLFA